MDEGPGWSLCIQALVSIIPVIPSQCGDIQTLGLRVPPSPVPKTHLSQTRWQPEYRGATLVFWNNGLSCSGTGERDAWRGAGLVLEGTKHLAEGKAVASGNQAKADPHPYQKLQNCFCGVKLQGPWGLHVLSIAEIGEGEVEGDEG